MPRRKGQSDLSNVTQHSESQSGFTSRVRIPKPFPLYHDCHLRELWIQFKTVGFLSPEQSGGVGGAGEGLLRRATRSGSSGDSHQEAVHTSIHIQAYNLPQIRERDIPMAWGH